MLDMFLLVLLSYIFSLVFFPIYKFYINSKSYIVLNLLFLLALLVSASTLAYKILILQSEFFLTFDFNNYLNNIVDYSFTITIKPLSFLFSYLVIIIGFSTNIYILNYFKGEADESIFIFWLNAFIASMLSLVLANSFYSLFLGWELIGLTSFFLINFWQTRRATLKSSFKAFSFNLLSDIFLLVALVCFYKLTNTTDCDVFMHIILWGNFSNNFLLQFGLISLAFCSAIKSVQIGAHLWLPDSMEAPVPASALIHSATLVSAGIYLICKFSCLYTLMGWSSILIFIGSLTAAYGGVVSAAQTDLKKLLAYSTMSHCGFLWVLACSGNFFITILYLFLHGLFKASSFYCVGSFVRYYGSQDSRLMGNSHIYLRLETILFLICGANLGGLPFSFGYYFKAFFFKLMLLNVLSNFSLSLLTIGLLSSLIYFFRLTFYVSFDFYKNVKSLPQMFLTQTTYESSRTIGSTTLTHLVSTVILLSFSVLFVILFSNYYANAPITFISSGLSGSAILVINLAVLYKSYYIIFYAVYTMIFFLIVFVGYRKSIFGVENIFIFFYFLLMSLLFIILKCEVIL